MWATSPRGGDSRSSNRLGVGAAARHVDCPAFVLRPSSDKSDSSHDYIVTETKGVMNFDPELFAQGGSTSDKRKNSDFSFGDLL